MIVHSRENETKKRQKLVIFAPKFDNVKFWNSSTKSWLMIKSQACKCIFCLNQMAWAKTWALKPFWGQIWEWTSKLQKTQTHVTMWSNWTKIKLSIVPFVRLIVMHLSMWCRFLQKQQGLTTKCMTTSKLIWSCNQCACATCGFWRLVVFPMMQECHASVHCSFHRSWTCHGFDWATGTPLWFIVLDCLIFVVWTFFPMHWQPFIVRLNHFEIKWCVSISVAIDAVWDFLILCCSSQSVTKRPVVQTSMMDLMINWFQDASVAFDKINPIVRKQCCGHNMFWASIPSTCANQKHAQPHMLSHFCCNHKNASVLETSTWQKHRWGHAEQSSQLKTNFISHLLHPNLNIWSFKLRVCNQKQSTGKRDYLHNPCHNLTPWTFWVTKHHLIDKLNPKERQIVTKMHEMGDVMGQPNKFFQQNVSTTNK